MTAYCLYCVRIIILDDFNHKGSKERSMADHETIYYI